MRGLGDAGVGNRLSDIVKKAEYVRGGGVNAVEIGEGGVWW